MPGGAAAGRTNPSRPVPRPQSVLSGARRSSCWDGPLFDHAVRLVAVLRGEKPDSSGHKGCPPGGHPWRACQRLVEGAGYGSCTGKKADGCDQEDRNGSCGGRRSLGRMDNCRPCDASPRWNSVLTRCKAGAPRSLATVAGQPLRTLRSPEQRQLPPTKSWGVKSLPRRGRSSSHRHKPRWGASRQVWDVLQAISHLLLLRPRWRAEGC